MLKEVSQFWGEVSVISDLPVLETHDNVTFMPLSRQLWFDDDPEWGLYDARGHLLEAAAYKRFRGAGQTRLLGQSQVHPRRFPVHETSVDDSEYIYIGPLITHYGHFICTSVARLWPLLSGGLKGRKLLMHVRNRLDITHFDYVLKSFAGLGITQNDIVTPEMPTRFERVLIPGPSMVEQFSIHPAHRQVCHKIGEQYLGDLDTETRRSPVYLSKSQLTRGITRIGNEAVVEQVLRAFGIEVIYPESLSLRDQVRLFAQNRVIVGTGGTQVHTGIFAPPRATVVSLSAKNEVNANLPLLDRINDRTVGYVYDDRGYNEVTRDGSFLVSQYLNDAEATAYELVDLIRELG